MKFEYFEVLDNEPDEGSYDYATTHPRIRYDSSVETFWVDLGRGGYCEVYGWNRAKRAFDIAETCFQEGQPLDGNYK